MEKDRVARLELAEDPFQSGQGRSHSFGVGAGLIADRAVVEPPIRCEPLRTCRQPLARVARSTATMQLARSGNRQPFSYQ